MDIWGAPFNVQIDVVVVMAWFRLGWSAEPWAKAHRTGTGSG